MSNVDCEIYLKQFIGFFQNNEEDLRKLIGNIDADMFYDEVRHAVFDKYENDGTCPLTRQEVIDIIVRLHKMHQTSTNDDLPNYIQKTKFGTLFLN